MVGPWGRGCKLIQAESNACTHAKKQCPTPVSLQQVLRRSSAARSAYMTDKGGVSATPAELESVWLDHCAVVSWCTEVSVMHVHAVCPLSFSAPQTRHSAATALGVATSSSTPSGSTICSMQEILQHAEQIHPS